MAIAFLDINPLTPGHTLVIPREHYRRVEAMPPEAASAVGMAVGRVTDAAQAAVDADGATVGVNNGAAAGQVVPHVHYHVIPRFEDDGGGNLHAVVDTRPGDDPDRIAEEIHAAMTAAETEE